MQSTQNNKNIFITNSILSRIDAHTGIYNLYVSGSKVGTHGISIIGSGKIFVDHTTFDHSDATVKLRNDYGSSWNGEIVLNDIDYIQNNATNKIIQYENTGQTNYGYHSTFPSLYINNFRIDSTKTGSKSNYVNIIKKEKNTPMTKPKNDNTVYYFKENMYIKDIKYTKGSRTANIFDSNFALTKNKSNLDINNYGGNKITNIYVSPDSKISKAKSKEAKDNLLMANKTNTKFQCILKKNKNK